MNDADCRREGVLKRVQVPEGLGAALAAAASAGTTGACSEAPEVVERAEGSHASPFCGGDNGDALGAEELVEETVRGVRVAYGNNVLRSSKEAGRERTAEGMGELAKVGNRTTRREGEEEK